MILFRCRQYGQAEWTFLTVATPGNDDETDEMEELLAASVRSMLNSSDLHVQEMNDIGEWEDVE